MEMKRISAVIFSALALAAPSEAWAADVSAREVTEALFRSAASGPVDYTGKNLSFLDLAGLDFKRATLAGVDLSGSDLTSANLTGSNLAGARLDRASLARANFSGANMKGVSLRTVAAHTTSEPNLADAPVFAGADLSDAHIASRLDGADFRNADLSRAQLGKLVATWGSYRPRAVLNGANFSGAKMVSADLSNAVLQFAQFRDADLSGAKMVDCDLTRAVLAGANLAGADVTGADFSGADLTGAKGFDTAIGVERAKNLKLAK